MLQNKARITAQQLRNNPLSKSLTECKTALWFTFLFSSGINLLVLFLPLYTSQVLDRVLSSGSIATLMMLTIITVTSFLCSSLLESCRSIVMLKISDWLDTRLSPVLIQKSLTMTSINKNTSTGEVIRDLNVVKNFIAGNGVFILLDVPWSLIYLVVIFMIHSATGLIAVIGIVLLVLMTIWNEVANKKLIREANEQTIRHINELEIAARNAEVVEAMGMSRYVITEWIKKNIQNRTLQNKTAMRSVILMSIIKFCRMTLQISVIGVGAYLALHGSKTVGGIIAASILMGRTLAPFEQAIAMWKNLSIARLSYHKLQSLLINVPNRSETMKLPTPIGQVTFDRVFFTPFNSNRPIIKGMSFSIDPGELVGVIGPSASGKSTIAKLIVGVFSPVSGVVRLDGANTYSWHREQFGEHVGYLPQDIELFNASVKENIARMKQEFSPEEVVKAAKITDVHEMILQLSEGYETVLGPGGSMLSGGQRQRIGLARAFYGNIKLLVLDEPNASLDSYGEAALANTLKYARTQKITTFIITHKIPLLSLVDKIIIVQNGAIAGMGQAEEMLQKIMPKR